MKYTKTIYTLSKYLTSISLGMISIALFGLFIVPLFAAPYGPTRILETITIKQAQDDKVVFKINKRYRYTQIGLLFSDINAKSGFVELPIKTSWEIVGDNGNKVGKNEILEGFYNSSSQRMYVDLFTLCGKKQEKIKYIAVEGDVERVLGGQASVAVYTRFSLGNCSDRMHVLAQYLIGSLQLLYFVTLYVLLNGNIIKWILLGSLIMGLGLLIYTKRKIDRKSEDQK